MALTIGEHQKSGLKTMRQLIALLLLSTAAPALAADPDGSAPSAEPRVEVERPARTERSERPSMFDRIRRAERREQAAAPESPPPQPTVRQEAPERWSPPVREPVRESRERPVSENRPDERMGEGVREWRWRERNAERVRRRDEVPPAGSVAPIGDRLARPEAVVPPVSAAPVARGADRGINTVLRNRIATEGWRREWRGDRRFDWRRHRDWNRDRFRIGFYYDPFGWNYRRWHVGRTLHPRFLSSRYWINDPFYYRLPPVYGPYRWVRYWDDALLVDLRSGRVVDVIHGFFW
jgi:Ni/Co efflux regulator RcnB